MRIISKLSHLSFLFGLCVITSQLTGLNQAEAAESTASKVETSATFGDLFVGSPCGMYGTVGCTQKGKQCNDNWNTYFSSTQTSISIVAGDDCRTVNTHDACKFTLGDNGLTQISFDFDVSGSCHGADGTEWLAFWMYRDPWANTAEVDFIESKYGPGTGLNTNFAGVGNQVIIFDGSTSKPWSGSVTAKFSGSGTAVSVSVSNSNNSNVGTTTLTQSEGYYFVMDTATGSTATDCKIKVSNLKVKGTVTTPTTNCVGLIVNP